MHKFNSEMAAYLREELGCKQLINACNWRTADMILTQDAEYWAYSANDVIARNCYVEVYHQGVQAGWNIQAGDNYADVSMIKNPVEPAHQREEAAGPHVHAPRDPLGAARSVSSPKGP